MPEKRNLRTNSLHIRKALSPGDRERKGKEIGKKLENCDLFKNADHILFYYTHGTEVDTVPLINKWAGKKQIYLPKLKSETKFIALPFNPCDTLKEGLYGIPEPIEHKDGKVYERKLDLIILPGAAFDRSCNRLGMGKGFYDRYLSQLKGIPKIALSFEEQMLDEVPKDTYDEPVDMIITDKEIYEKSS